MRASVWFSRRVVMMRVLTRCALVLALCLVLPTCVSSRKMVGQEASDLDRKLTTFSWIEEGDLLTFIVNTRAARDRGDSPYIPLEISVANRGVKKLQLARESFVLHDAQNNQYPLAGSRELMESYKFLDWDRRLSELEGIVSDKFAAFQRYHSNFSPTRTVNPQVVRDRITLPKFGYLVDVLYFPRPITGVRDQRFELFLHSPDLPDPVFVKFEIR